MTRRAVILAVAADVVTGVAVFLPWAGVSGGSATVAAWGSAATPRLLGLVVLACVATALSVRGGVLLAGSDVRAALHAVAILLDGAAAILALIVVTGAESFVGTDEPADARYGVLLALAGAVVGAAAGVVALATATRQEPGAAQPAA